MAELLAAARDLIHEQVDWDNVDNNLIEAIKSSSNSPKSSLRKAPSCWKKASIWIAGEFAIDQTTGYSKGEIYLTT